MATRKKATKAAEVGTVLRKVSSSDRLGHWAKYAAENEPWSTLGIGPSTFLDRWMKQENKFQFFAGTDPKSAKVDTFDADGGLVVFTIEGATAAGDPSLRSKIHELVPTGRATLVEMLVTKPGYKSVGKNLLSAVERIVSNQAHVIVSLVSDDDASAIRSLKAHGFDEYSKADNYPVSGKTGLIFVKKLAT